MTGGFGAVEGGADGTDTVGVGLTVTEADGDGVSLVGDVVADSLGDSATGGGVVIGDSLTAPSGEGVGDTESPGSGTDSAGVGSSLSVPFAPAALSATEKAAGSMPVTLPVPGSTMSRRSPAGRGTVVPAPERTRTSTALDAPTQAGSVPPRAAPDSP